MVTHPAESQLLDLQKTFLNFQIKIKIATMAFPQHLARSMSLPIMTK